MLILLLSLTLFAQRPDPGPSPRPNPDRDAALAQVVAVTSGQREDDHPAIAQRDGTVWMTWVSYSEAEHAGHIYARSWKANQWSQPVRVTQTAGDYHKPALAIDRGGVVVVVWPAQVRGNWDLYARRRLASGGWSPVERLTTDDAPDVLPQLAFSGARMMLVWQSMRKANHDILYRVHENGAWGPEGFVTESAAGDWEPVIAATGDGAFHVAWDSFRGDYDVLLRTWRNRQWSPEMAVAASAKLENHVSISSDAQDRVWLAWETGPENWAADSAEGGLRARREIGLACLMDGKLYRVPAPEAGARGWQAPLLAASGGGVRLLARQPLNNNWLTVQATAWTGSGWGAWETLPYSEGRVDQRIVAAPLSDGRILAAYPAGSSHNVVYAKVFAAVKEPMPLTPMDAARAKAAPPAPPKHRLQGYTLVWGDLHRHTDISEDGGILDGSLMDAMRYALDAGGLDFLGITDHTRYLPRRYNLYRIQQINDAFYKPGAFAPLHAYERSQYSPWGHRNVVHQERDFTPVPASYDLGDPGVSPWGLFDALRGGKAMSIPHTSAWGNKQVSWDYFDPQVERLVEIYQGLRSTYEYNGAPDPAGRAVYEKDSKNFVWDALARGRKLGFIASSDHTTVQGAPELNVAVTGTAEIARVDVIKNGAFAYNVEPKSRSAKFVFRDQGFEGKESYYYVRVIQTDQQMAWSSPIWVKP
ncbi:MAG: hypothetical protein HY235_18155 [Acidobacteria bacterium]|nr:hypothetical protein [Acidobacteriota bacterium]